MSVQCPNIFFLLERFIINSIFWSIGKWFWLFIQEHSYQKNEYLNDRHIFSHQLSIALGYKNRNAVCLLEDSFWMQYWMFKWSGSFTSHRYISYAFCMLFVIKLLTYVIIVPSFLANPSCYKAVFDVYEDASVLCWCYQ